jgi:hypothetical protein
MALEPSSLSSNWKRLQAKLKTENKRQCSAHDDKSATDPDAELGNRKSRKRKRDTREVTSAVQALKRRKSTYKQKRTKMGMWESKVEDGNKPEHDELTTPSATMALFVEDGDLEDTNATGSKRTNTCQDIQNEGRSKM